MNIFAIAILWTDGTIGKGVGLCFLITRKKRDKIMTLRMTRNNNKCSDLIKTIYL